MTPDSERTVLIVDDEESLGELYSQYLTDHYETRVASTSGEALVELTAEVDLVLLDRRLPGMSGDELLEHITDWQTDCQVILVTAVDIDTDIIDMPCEGYLKKPVSRDEVLDAVTQAFLIDTYEELIFEYYEAHKKYAALDAGFSRDEIETERFDRLEARISEIETEINDTIDQFPDSEMADAFRGLHRTE